MKIAIGLALAAGIGCAHPQPAPTTPVANAAKPVPAAALDGANHSGPLEERVARLEKKLDDYADALEFLQKVYDQQNQMPDPDAVYAVDITSNVKLGMMEGPPQALVTIVEAWDFG